MTVDKYSYKKFLRLAFCVFLCLVLLGQNAKVYNVYAETSVEATIVCSASELVAAREGAGTNFNVMHNLASGKSVIVLDETTGTDGKKWYKIKYYLNVNGQECISYVRSDFVKKAQNKASTAIYGAATTTGTINRNNVSIRNAAGTSGTTILSALYIGDVVTIIGQTTVGSDLWYQINCTKNGTAYNGAWVYGAYVTVQTAPVIDPTYAQSLRDAGFPESYISSLCTLHATYPNWSFEAVNTGLDWNTVVASESVNGKNLVPKNSNDSKKSTAAGAYDWNTNQWTIYDGSTWVSASPEYIAYCMDPRNYLNDTYIFQFLNLKYSGTENIAGVQSILAGTFMTTPVVDTDGVPLSYDQKFVEIGAAIGVSPYHLASRVRQEQGAAGTSSLISGVYPGFEGYFNYFNISAYGATKDAVIQSGLTYAKNKGWDSRAKSLLGGSQILADKYISKGQDTLYFQKFNVIYADALYSHQYMSNVEAAISEAKSYAVVNTDKTQACSFRIPIYLNMPEKPVSFVEKGNPNNYLKSLTIEGVELTPSFSGDITSYSAVVENPIASINISATAVASTSTIEGIGKVELNVGNNNIVVRCTSKSGDVKDYNIIVSRLQPGENASDFALTSEKYVIGEIVCGIAPDTKVSTFLKNVVATNGTIKVLKASGEENKTKIATGNKIVVYDDAGNMQSTYEVVVYGDINGDGSVNALDMIKLNRHILGLKNLSGVYLQAADTNRKDDGINALDMIILNRHTLGLSKIKQS